MPTPCRNDNTRNLPWSSTPLMKKLIGCAVLFALAVLIVESLPAPDDALPGKARGQASAEPNKGHKAHGIPARTPWTTSRITGTPEPPHPYRIVRAYSKLQFRNPLLMTRAPGMN